MCRLDGLCADLCHSTAPACPLGQASSSLGLLELSRQQGQARLLIKPLFETAEPLGSLPVFQFEGLKQQWYTPHAPVRAQEGDEGWKQACRMPTGRLSS